MRLYEAIIRWPVGKWDPELTEEEISQALCDHFERDFACGNIQFFERKGEEYPVQCPHGDDMKAQATCRSFEYDDETGWCVHWDDDADYSCNDKEIRKILNE